MTKHCGTTSGYSGVCSTLLYKRLLASRGAMQEVLASSRSASRKKTTAIENLRAIPRVFS